MRALIIGLGRSCGHPRPAELSSRAPLRFWPCVPLAPGGFERRAGRALRPRFV